MAESIVSGLRDVVGHAHPVEVVELIPSGGGILDVTVDGELIFSKHREHRYPDADDVLELLKKRLSAS